MLRSALLALAVALVAAPTAAAETPSRRDVVHELNVARHAHGLHALHRARLLRRTATRHSRRMARLHFFDHRGFAARAARLPYDHVGETLAWTEAPSARSIVASWLASPEHRRIVLGRYRRVGVGIAHRTPLGSPGLTVTAEFGRR